MFCGWLEKTWQTLTQNISRMQQSYDFHLTSHMQPEVHPGKCWAFRGSKGFLEISLSYPIRITHVTLEHVPKTLSPTGEIDSEPKDFVVYESTQVFNIVELRILSNWGHPEYTCVYRFRVHGVPWVINGLK